ncbi:serine hydrolase [Bacillus mangrovi]|uniref:Serine hydrolase n=1 Tax=Metabacillus mangrovi TaxID=1491830 RepID=A0A7X2S6R7_9BACI|nr:serine hydrolase [Metabacillus mangrovi]MTH53811.1 serine hydrolase [Metabacillus mangrovi]
MKKKWLTVIAFFLLAGCTQETAKQTEKEPSVQASEEKAEAYWPTEDWKSIKPERVHMDQKKLDSMFEQIKNEEIPMEGLLVIRDGYIVAEQYGGGFDREKVHPVYSITKSLTSSLTGVAVKQGEIKSVDEKAVTYLDEKRIENVTEQKKALTIKNFLTMTSGLPFPEQTEKGFYQSEQWKTFMEGADPAYYALSLPIQDDQNTWNYSTADSAIASKIIQEAAGMPLAEYAEKHLFSHLGIKDVHWPADRSGTSLGGTGVEMKPRDIAKIGYLYMNNGKWEDQQLLPENWVKESTSPHADTNGNFEGDRYGYSFWLKKVGGYDTYRAMGLYGQYMVVIPELDLIAVQTSSGMDIDPLLEEFVIPAVQDK